MAHRVVTPVNLKERIALLQQKANSSSPHASGSATSGSAAAAGAGASALGSPNGSASSSAANSPAGSGSALRERIAKFEQKGGVPVPRGSFGIGAPPLQLEQTHEGSAARKRGELYGNRIASVSRATPAVGLGSPPSAIRHQLTGNAAVISAAAKSLVPSMSAGSNLSVELGDGSPVRKRCVSTSGLAGIVSSSSSGAFSSSISGDTGTFDDDGSSAVLDVQMSTNTMQLSISDDDEAKTQARRSSISGADAMRSVVSVSDSSVSDTDSDNNARQPLANAEDSRMSRTVGEKDSMASTSIDDHDHVTPEDQHHQSVAEQQRADSVPPSDINNVQSAEPEPGPDASPRPETTEGESAPAEQEDESSVKTPVVATFSPNLTAAGSPPPATSEDASSLYSEAQEITLDPRRQVDSFYSDISSVSTSLTVSTSPLSASLEVGERAYCEPHKYVVLPPCSKDETKVDTLEQDGMQSAESAKDSENVRESFISPSDSVSVRDISGTSERRDSTQTVSIPSSVPSPTSASQKSPLTPQSTGSGSSRRRSPPAPLNLQKDEKHYVEPSLEPKSAPKSFHAVVHGKKTHTSAPAPPTTLPRSTVPRTQVVVIHPKTGDPGTPGSPDLSALVAQAMYLEQRLTGGDGEVRTPRPDAEGFRSVQQLGNANAMNGTKPQTSHVKFPSRVGVQWPLEEVMDIGPAPPPKDPSPLTISQTSTTNTSAGNRKSWSRSSGNASSEDSVPVLTPPSPTFDLSNLNNLSSNPPLFDIGMGIGNGHSLDLDVGSSIEQHSDKHSIGSGSGPSSPGQSSSTSIRKKSLDRLRTNTMLGRMLSRSTGNGGKSNSSNSTLALAGVVAGDGGHEADCVPRSCL
ncbi:uncharacterized protein FOMMEDRAFT_21020 [Fomitiporia mediterranea MF3/22]|uniref:uncharacterized protein n=1 Tax=Fomitiporia mediterranea (strain MF3/22) TaxID=694068 RepID=UPI000440977C|nr:uncharacterized protein FOMMEDRAFT_21020 [Fomitiporia mediterranea MF3/22]EJD02266.1 hypothetical protein FOMMEDRAFT_21020 [Fomitiporia mediterranea MF3/22]